ncbi:MAG: hypothetical protein ACR2PA_11345 [Hyphomicrobiaceae bacterium]
MLFKSLALSLCVALAGVAGGTIVFFLVHTNDTGEPVQATLEITKEWTTETHSDLNSIGTWFTSIDASPQIAGEGSREGDTFEPGHDRPDKAIHDKRAPTKRWPNMMTLGAQPNR